MMELSLEIAPLSSLEAIHKTVKEVLWKVGAIFEHPRHAQT